MTQIDTANRSVQNILGGAGFVGFRFDTGFTLEFIGASRTEATTAATQFVLRLDSRWRIGTGPTVDIVRGIDEEAEQAAQLVKLRWSEFSTLTAAELVSTTGLRLEFGERYWIVVEPLEGDESWEILTYKERSFASLILAEHGKVQIVEESATS